jgi:uncharacterized protein (DUF433 family)
MAELFSASDAAAIAEVSPETMRNALEKKSITPARSVKTGKSVRYQFSVGDVLFVKLLAEFPFPLSRQDKHSLAQLLARGNKRAESWSLQGNDLVYRSGDVQIRVACKPFRRTVARNLAAWRWGKQRVVSSPDVLSGEPVFKGTRIPLRHVAALLRKGVREREVKADFPTLGARDLEYARLFARSGERPGRPRKPLLIRREHVPTR